MPGHTALMAGWGGNASDVWGRKQLYAGGGGNYLMLTPDKVGIATSYGGAVSTTLPPGWRYGIKYGNTNYGAALFETPIVLDGAPVGAGAVRQTIAFVAQANTSLLSPGIADHAIVGCRHPGVPYTSHGMYQNRSDALLVGGAGIWGLVQAPCTIEGIEGASPDNVWPMTIGQAYYGLSATDEALFVLESLQYDTVPWFRFRVLNRVSTVYDSGARYPTGSTFTSSHNNVLIAGVNMDDSLAFRFAIFKMWSFMHPRDTEVPISVIRDTIGY